jgi:antitoxin VapB
MPIVTAKVFKAGNSQAIRLPKAFRLTTETVQIEKTARGLLILDPRVEAKRLRSLRRLYGSCPEFPEVERLQPNEAWAKAIAENRDAMRPCPNPSLMDSPAYPSPSWGGVRMRPGRRRVQETI